MFSPNGTPPSQSAPPQTPRPGSIAAHSSTCVPPIEPPTAANKPPDPQRLRPTVFLARTMSRIVTVCTPSPKLFLPSRPRISRPRAPHAPAQHIGAHHEEPLRDRSDPPRPHHLVPPPGFPVNACGSAAHWSPSQRMAHQHRIAPLRVQHPRRRIGNRTSPAARPWFLAETVPSNRTTWWRDCKGTRRTRPSAAQMSSSAGAWRVGMPGVSAPTARCCARQYRPPCPPPCPSQTPGRPASPPSAPSSTTSTTPCTIVMQAHRRRRHRDLRAKGSVPLRPPEAATAHASSPATVAPSPPSLLRMWREPICGMTILQTPSASPSPTPRPQPTSSPLPENISAPHPRPP